MSVSEVRDHIHRRRRNLAFALVVLALVASLVVAALLATHVVEVSAAPADAEPTLAQKKGAMLIFGQRVFLYSAEGTVTASAEGFFPRDIAVSRSDEARRLPVRLEPRPGIVTIAVESAEEFLVRVDGGIVGNAPELELELAPGMHVVTIRGPRIERFDEEIEVAGRGAAQTFTFAPVPTAPVATVEFRVAAEPSSARISIDGAVVGTGTYAGAVQPGRRAILIEADDFAPHRREIDVAADAGAVDIGTISLSPLPARVAIRSNPAGATVLVNGDFRGATPLETQLAAAGEHRLSVRKAGFHNVEEVLRPAPNARLERTYELTTVTYRARIATNLPAQIQINGRIVGNAPLTVDVMDNDEIRAIAGGLAAKPIRVRPGAEGEREYAFELMRPGELAFESAALETTAAGIRLRKFAPAHFDARESEQAPANMIELSRAFYFAVFETTIGDYRGFDPSFAPGLPETRPATAVTWQDAAKFCNWLSAEAGLPPAYELGAAFAKLDPDSLGFRLPTEAEWEAIARYDFAAGRVRGRPNMWGSSPTIPRAFANVAGRELRAASTPFLPDFVDNHPGIAPVGTYPPNFNGIHDLGGNVSEWVHDYYRSGPFMPDVAKDPLGPRTGTDRVVKGANHLSADRAALSPGYRTFAANRSDTVGFRVARWIH